MGNHSERPEERKLSTDRDTIHQWADEHGAIPVRHREEPDRYRIVPESETAESHETVEWDDLFSQLDEGDHVVIYHGAEATDPFEVTRREEALARTGTDGEDLQHRLVEGETITTEVTETTVVESVVVEEATIESELVDTEVLDERVVDVELLRRECTSCDLVEEGAPGRDDWFDERRYFDAVDRTETEAADAEMGAVESTADAPYHAELDVEEAWSVTREYTERFTVESRVADTDLVETNRVEDRDIDVEGLQRTIAESDLLEIDLSPDDVLLECDIDSEFSEDDRIHTHFTREHVVEDEVVDRKRVHADVTEVELLTMEAVHTEDVVTEETGSVPADTTGTRKGATEAIGDEPASAGAPAELSDDDIGKSVVDAAGEEIGMIADVGDDGELLYVDAHPGITEKIKAALDWGDVDDDDFPVEVEQVQRVTDDQVKLKGADEIDSNDPAR